MVLSDSSWLKFRELPALHLKANNFSRLAFGVNLERPAAYFAISREALDGDARIDNEVEALAAKRTLNRC